MHNQNHVNVGGSLCVLDKMLPFDEPSVAVPLHEGNLALEYLRNQQRIICQKTSKDTELIFESEF